MSTQTDEREAQRTVNTLCTIEALRILATPATGDDEDIRNFAQEALLQFLRFSKDFYNE